jgi:3-oxosteroid 1-dehydrogenase
MAPGTNTGDGIRAAAAIGASTELLDQANWWPTTLLPNGTTNSLLTHFMFRNPHSICVNRWAERFVDECTAYDRFGRAMIADHQRTGATIPSWIIFDADCRRDYLNGGILPGRFMPDKALPKEYWDAFIFKADTLEALARKIDLDSSALIATVSRFNDFARQGKDVDFGRGETDYDRILGGGDPAVSPNPCLAPVARAPFYAMRIFLGDLGTKGGLRTTADGQVVEPGDVPITGLYAVGNTAASIFRNAYPGPGTTLGPAMIFAYAAVEHIVGQSRNFKSSDRAGKSFA